MNIVYLIGNGFDLNLGMRTKYEHFYEYYLSNCEDNDSIHIKNLKEDITKDKQNWSDLEEALGRYLNNIGINEAIMLHSNLIRHLSKYFTSEENKFIFDEKQNSIFHNYLVYPHLNNRLLFVEKEEIDDNMMKWRGNTWYVDIITFNYTKSIERLLGYNKDKRTPIGTYIHKNTSYSIILSEIEHIHGFSDERMILGVNDVSQIINDKLRNETRIINRYVKSDCNNTYGWQHDEKCQKWINNATLICLFGLSFGETDKKWWEIIGERLIKGCKIILFEYNSNKQFNGNQGPDIQEEKEKVKDRFLSKTNIDEDLKGEIKNNIYVAYNTDMFKFDIKKKNENIK